MFRYFLMFLLAFVFSSQACLASDPPAQVKDENEVKFAGGDIAFGAESKGFFGDTIQTISQKVHKNAISWAKPLKEVATTLFLALMGISLVWTLIEIALRQGTIGEIFAELTKNFIFFGLFMCVVKNADDIAGIIYNSFTGLGANAAGGQAALGSAAKWSNSAGGLAGEAVDTGLNYIDAAGRWIQAIYDYIGWTSPVTAIKGVPFALLSLVVGFIIFLVCALMCIKLLVAEATLWVVMYGGIFILGFGASKWTKDIAISYLKTVMAMSFSYFGMLLLGNIMIAELTHSYGLFNVRVNNLETMLDTESTTIDAEWFALIPELAFALILYFIMDKIPQIFSSMINGMHFTAGPSSFAAAGAAMAAGAARVMAPFKLANKAFEKMGLHKPKESNTDKSLREISTEIKDLNKKFGSDANAGNASNGIKNLSKNREGESAKNTSEAKTESQEKSDPPDSAKMKQDDAGSEAKSQSQAQTVSQTKDSSSQSNQSDVIDLTKEDYTVTTSASAADDQKPAVSSEGSASSEQASSQPQIGYFEQLEKEIASNAEKKAQESSSQNDSKQTFTAQDANRYKSFYAAKKDFPQLERSEWSKATKDSYKNFTAKDASRYEDIYAARKDYPHLDLAAWQNARIKSTLDKAADAAKKKDN